MSIPIATLIAAGLAFIAALANLIFSYKIRRDKFIHDLFLKRLDLYLDIANDLIVLDYHWDHVSAGVRKDPPFTADDLMLEFVKFQDSKFPIVALIGSKTTLREMSKYVNRFNDCLSSMEVGQLADPTGDTINAMREELGLNQISKLSDRLFQKRY